MSWLFASGGQSIRASASASVPLMNIQDWSPLGWTGWISLQSKGLSTVFFNTTVQKHQFSGAQPPSWSHSHSPYMTTGKTIALTRQTFVSRVMSLLFNTVYICHSFSSKEHLFHGCKSPSAVILETKKIKSLTVSIVSSSVCHEVMELEAMICVFPMLSFMPAFSPLSPSSGVSLVPLHFLPLGWCHLHIWGCWYFSQHSWLQLVLHPAWHFSWCTLHIG